MNAETFKLTEEEVDEFQNYINMWEVHATQAMKYWLAMFTYWYPKEYRRELIKKIFKNPSFGV